jgi:hypothetical protein
MTLAFSWLFIPSEKLMFLLFYINVPAFAIFCYWDKPDLLTISTFIAIFGATVPILVSCAIFMSSIYEISSQFERNMEKKI